MSDTYIFREIDYNDKPFTLKFIGFYNNYSSKEYIKVLIEKLRNKYPKNTILTMKVQKGWYPKK